jgi:hypothetical protein
MGPSEEDRVPTEAEIFHELFWMYHSSGGWNDDQMTLLEEARAAEVAPGESFDDSSDY